TGSYTVLTQIAADAMGFAIEDVTFQLGDSALPYAPVEGGSFTVASVGAAAKDVCEKLRKKLFSAARKVKDSPLAAAGLKDLTISNGFVVLQSDPDRRVSIRDAMQNIRGHRLEAASAFQPNFAKQMKYTRVSHTAVFAEVKVDEDLGSIEVS